MRQKKSVQSLGRALSLLEALQKDPLTAAELSDRLNLPRSTVFRFLSDLEARGYVRRGAPATFGLGLKLVELSGALLSQLHVGEAGRWSVASLGRDTGLTVTLGVREDKECVCIDRFESSLPIRLTVSIGRRTPLYATAMSKVLLAFSPPEVIAHVLSTRLQKLASGTITNSKRLQAELQRIRVRGFATSESEFNEGARGVAAPIHGLDEHVVAALAAAGPANLVNFQDQRLIAALLTSSGQISEKLGYRPSEHTPLPSAHARHAAESHTSKRAATGEQRIAHR